MGEETGKSFTSTTGKRHPSIWDSTHPDFADRTINRILVSARRLTFKFSSPILNKMGGGYFFLKFYKFFARFGERLFKLAFFFFDLSEHILNECEVLTKNSA